MSNLFESIAVTRQKIDHYTKTGNTAKLAIYQAKLRDLDQIQLAVETAKTFNITGETKDA